MMLSPPVSEQFCKLIAGQWVKVEHPDEPCIKVSLWASLPLDEQLSHIEAMFSGGPFTLQFSGSQPRYYWNVFGPGQELRAIIQKCVTHPFDYLFWPSEGRAIPKLLLFDMDSTFIEIEVIDELAKIHGVGEQVASVTESAMRGELDFGQSLLSRVACLKGLSQTAIDAIANNLPVSEGVFSLLASAKQNACQVAIVSGGFRPFVEKLKHDLSLFAVKANQLEVIDGQLTGKLLGEIVDAKAKADFLLELCHILGIVTEEVMAIGDGANDLLMMDAAGFNLAYRAKPKVVAKAKGRIESTHLGWLVDILGWRKAPASACDPVLG